MKKNVRACIVTGHQPHISETFIRAHINQLPGAVCHAYRKDWIPWVAGSPILSQSKISRAIRKTRRWIARSDWSKEIHDAYEKIFRKYAVNVVLAEYGTAGACIAPLCQSLDMPLVVHFHGFDASKYSVIANTKQDYEYMFESAAAIIAVSHRMRGMLQDLGCTSEKLVYNPYGVNDFQFATTCSVKSTTPVFLSVGRFTDKKAPHVTLTAFKTVLTDSPKARLRMIGDGALLDSCKDLAIALRINSSVDFLGSCNHAKVADEMSKATAFVQHSVRAQDGDMEGTPVAVLEAGYAGLPVVATSHAGIPDVIVEGVTGLLCDEHDVRTMADNMLKLIHDPDLANKMGQTAKKHVLQNFSMKRSLSRLESVLQLAANNTPLSELEPFEVLNPQMES